MFACIILKATYLLSFFLLGESFSRWELSLTYNSLQSSQPTYLRELFTIRPIRSTRSLFCLTLSRPSVTSHPMFSNRAISITAPCLCNDLPPELRTISSPPPPSLSITRHHLHLPSLSVTPGPSTQN